MLMLNQVLSMSIKKVTFSQFCKYLSKTGMHKYNAAKAIDKEINSEYQIPKDYWGLLRSHIKHVLANSGKADDLDDCLDRVAEDRKSNYLSRIEGLKKYWGKKTFEKVNLPKKEWKHKDLRVKVYAELCYSYRERIHIVKLFFSSETKKITKNEADLLLEVMKETYGFDSNEVVYGILDLPKGTLFKYKKNAPEISMLVRCEAETLLKMLNQLEQNTDET